MMDLKLIFQKNPGCLANNGTVKGILMDCGLERRTVQVMVNLYDCGIVQKIQKCGGMLSQTEVYYLAVEQERLYGTSRQFAEEGIRQWADALGAMVEEPVQPKPIPEPAPEPQSDPISDPQKLPSPKKKSPLLGGLLKILFGFFVIIVVSIVFASISTDSSSAGSTRGTVGEHIQWKLKDGTLTISGSGPMEDYKFLEYAPWADTEEKRSAIHAISVEEGITRIGDYSFYDCEKLTDVTIADSVTEIGEFAFEDCWELSNVKFPANLEQIESWAFFNCGSLMDVDIPRSTSFIGWQAFQGTELRNVFLGDATFSYMSFDEDVNVVDSLQKSGTCGENAKWVLDEAGLLTVSGTGDILPYNADSVNVAAPWYTQRMDITGIVIEEGITGVGAGAFYDCGNLTKVSIPDSVSHIGRDVFAYCSSLTGIRLPDSVTEIPLDSFVGCTALTSVQLPSQLATIEARAFENCESLEKMTIPNSVATIGMNAFDGCSNLRSVTVPKNCVVEEGAFPEWVEIK